MAFPTQRLSARCPSASLGVWQCTPQSLAARGPAYFLLANDNSIMHIVALLVLLFHNGTKVGPSGREMPSSVEPGEEIPAKDHAMIGQ